MNQAAASVSTNLSTRDVLCELVNIGSGNALTSLSRMIGKGRMISSVPTCFDKNREYSHELTSQDSGVALVLHVTGKLSCSLFAVFEQNSARRLANLLLGKAWDGETNIGPEEESALLEAMNIASCSFLGALAVMVQGVLVPSPPQICFGDISTIFKQCAPNHGQDILVMTPFADQEERVQGHFLVIAGASDAQCMVEAVGVTS